MTEPRCRECKRRSGHKMDCTYGRTTAQRTVLSDADIEALADEAEAGYDFCAVCRHQIRLVGDTNASQQWRCGKGCQCLMLGCVPIDAKYGTAP